MYNNTSIILLMAVGVFFVSCKDSAVNSIQENDVEGNTPVVLQSVTNETENVFISDENVITWNHINVSTDVNWPTTVCKPDGSIGLDDPRWTRVDGQTAYNIRPLLDNGLHAFESWWSGIHHPNNFGEAEWINSVYKRKSTEMNPDGDGHNWTRYEIPVDGNGTYELKLLADNCSWIYLDDQLVGYQDDAGLDNANNIRYGVTLNGPATLSYIIFDGGGDAGGKFRLETTTEDIPEFEPPAPEPTVYTSQAGIQTYEPILVPRNSDHGTSQCTNDGSIGEYVVGFNDSRWVPVDHGAYSVRSLLPSNYNNEFTFERAWSGIHGLANFNAEWINAKNTWRSDATVPTNYSGSLPYGGANWTRYDLPVEGNGDFELKLLADDCSWIYLSDEDGSNPSVIGYQDNPGPNGPDKINYGVSLDGKHLLTFIIFDQGGEAGGKFILETTTDYVPPYVPPAPVNNAPVADAGSDQSVVATGQTTAITLDGSASSDPDGDALSYSWTLNGNVVSTSETAVINLADGSYTLTLTVSDGELSDSDDVNVTVVNTIPVADAGEDQTLEATGPTTAVTLNGSGSTDADGDVLTYEWSNGSTDVSTIVNLGVGVHTITLTVTDEQGATDSDDVTVTIEDTTMPELSYDQVTGSLWPPNHKMVKVVTGIRATDLVDGSTDVAITVSSNEPANGKGDGNTDVDYEIQAMPDGSYSVYVLSERSGKGSGRVYTIDISSSDNAGNTASASLEVSVPKSQGRR